MMKLKNLLFGGLLAGLMVSCSDDFAPDQDQVLENETTTFVRLSLVNPGNTRAEYENGSAAESKINEILLTFFDGGRNYVGSTLVPVHEDNTIDVPGGLNTVERVLTVVAEVNLPEHINYPSWVIAYVNPTSESGDLKTDVLDDAMKVIRARNTVSHNPGYRTMNNSGYFNEDTGYYRFATAVDFQNQFFATEDEARDASDEESIVITVERLEAKVRFSSDLNNIEQEDFKGNSSTDGDQEYSLHFTPQAWFVNATEKRTFLIKNYRSIGDNYITGNGPDNDNGMNLNTLKGAFRVNAAAGDQRANEVNDANNLRSYWALDPTYFDDDEDNLYPDISYDVRYGTVNPSGNDKFPLLYRSYQNVMAEQNAGVSTNYATFENRVKKHEYVLENTMNRPTLQSNKAMASMSSVVLIGYYTIKNKAGNEVFNGSSNDETKAFYVRHEADAKKYIMLGDNEAKDFFLERGGSTLFVQEYDVDGNPVEGSFVPLRAAHLQKPEYGVSYNDFDLVYPKKDVAGTKLSEQWRTMQLHKGTNGQYNPNIYIYDSTLDEGNGGYRAINDADIASVNARLFSAYGVLERFSSGKAYFNVPLKHIWGVGSSSNEFDASKIVLGDYGVVRNHVYDLTINSIKGLGTGIGDITQPIVPPTENDRYFINTRLNILQWRLVSQSVDL